MIPPLIIIVPSKTKARNAVTSTQPVVDSSCSAGNAGTRAETSPETQTASLEPRESPISERMISSLPLLEISGARITGWVESEGSKKRSTVDWYVHTVDS